MESSLFRKAILFPAAVLAAVVGWPARADNFADLHEFSLTTGLHTPLARPYFALGFGVPVGRSTITARASVSLLSLKSSFASAGKQSQYADKLTAQDASLLDVSLFLPEYTFPVWEQFFLNFAPGLRFTRINAAYLTPANESLSFSGWGLAVGIAAGGGYRIAFSDSLVLDVLAQILAPLAYAGRSDIDFSRDNTVVPTTFSDTDLSQILDALEPYMQSVTKQTTLGSALRLVYRF
ncbi:hypothetical protein EBR21_14035 [bacterium]|nr:hypothetical protein [bacterium]